MPELAEVECMRRRWSAGIGGVVEAVDAHPRARVFRDCPAAAVRRGLRGAGVVSSARSGKQMAFSFGEGGWLGIHLGMTGELLVAGPDHPVGRHDHLVLRQENRSLIFRDPRMFGRVIYSRGAKEPEWWANRPPEIIDRRFTRAAMMGFLTRRGRAPLKAVLLMQEHFPGIGNWMADEVLWRARIHPGRRAGSLSGEERAALFAALKFVCRGSLRTIVNERNGRWGDPPRGWLFHVRWEEGSVCPQAGKPLRRETIGGRTTCWSPARQS